MNFRWDALSQDQNFQFRTTNEVPLYESFRRIDTHCCIRLMSLAPWVREKIIARSCLAKNIFVAYLRLLNDTKQEKKRKEISSKEPFHSPLINSALKHCVGSNYKQARTMKYTNIATAAVLVAFTDFDVASAATSRTRGVERGADTEGRPHRALSPDNKTGGKGGSVSLAWPRTNASNACGWVSFFSFSST